MLDAVSDSRAYTITAALVASPSQTIQLRDVLFGDVWLCVGQLRLRHSVAKVRLLTYSSLVCLFTLPCYTVDAAVANRSRSASYNSLSGRIGTCAECLLCEITYRLSRNTAKAAAGLQLMAAPSYVIAKNSTLMLFASMQ